MKGKSLKESGITLIALVVTIIILLILAGVAIASVTGDNGLFRKAREATNLYKDAEKGEQGVLRQLENELGKLPNQSTGNPDNPDVSDGPKPSSTTPTNTIPTFSTDYGRIDVIWLKDNTNAVATTANIPNLYTGENSLRPVTWSKNAETKNWTEDSIAKSTWYNYNETDRQWANAKNIDNSYFVWIPRYAYRITYYEDEACTNVTGYYDGYGMYDAVNGTLNYKADEGIETVDYNEMKYIVHPAFTGVGKEDNGGGFGDTNGISGFWVAKFEMSEETNIYNDGTWYPGDYNGDYLDDRETSSNYSRAVSKPSVISWRGICIGYSFSNAYKYDRNKESHLIKNSEWGAVTYLSYSKFGRNGKQCTPNNDMTNVTGVAGFWTSSSTGRRNTYETENGTMASTTGNIYGIYDMAGGAIEYTAAFDSLSTSSRLVGNTYSGSNAQIMTSKAKDENGTYISTKYVTTYHNGGDSGDSRADIIRVGKTGDAIKEVRMSSKNCSWGGTPSCVLFNESPFMGRGGQAAEESHSGVFTSNNVNGDVPSYIAYRVVLSN